MLNGTTWLIHSLSNGSARLEVVSYRPRSGFESAISRRSFQDRSSETTKDWDNTIDLDDP